MSAILSTIIGIAKTAGLALLTPKGAGIGLALLIIGYILKRLDNSLVKGWVIKPFHWLAIVVEKFFLGIGVACTLGLSRYKLTKPFWNKTLEPYFIDLFDNVVNGILDGVEEVINAARRGLITGLLSDKK